MTRLSFEARTQKLLAEFERVRSIPISEASPSTLAQVRDLRARFEALKSDVIDAENAIRAEYERAISRASQKGGTIELVGIFLLGKRGLGKSYQAALKRGITQDFEEAIASCQGLILGIDQILVSLGEIASQISGSIGDAREDYYAILEITPSASPEEIKEQYHLLIQAWHPDRFTNPKQKAAAEAKAKQINEAYEVLRDPEKRSRYDRIRTASTTSTAQWKTEKRCDKNQFWKSKS